jgi:hypothetical protein
MASGSVSLPRERIASWSRSVLMMLIDALQFHSEVTGCGPVESMFEATNRLPAITQLRNRDFIHCSF